MEKNAPSGILIIDKPKGITSHDVVNIARRLFKIKRIGHAGTLDPIATGVLVVLVGKATKRSGFLMSGDKEYEVKMRLGITTDTGDAFGSATETGDTQKLTPGAIEDTIKGFMGEIEQVPPMFSAVKFKGKSLYKWARKGINVTRKARKVTIKGLSIKKITMPDVLFDVLCSKGTYIRQLCADIGEKLGCGAHMAELRRVRAGDFHISQAIGIDSLKSLSPDELNKKLIS